MSEFKIGDKLTSKANDCGLTKGKKYRIFDIEIIANLTYISIYDDHGNIWHYNINNESSAYYYVDYFYTKSELRDMKLNELGI